MVTPAEKGTTLVTLARSAIAQELGGGTLARPVGAGWLDEHGATFVTLQQSGNLRGCIGSIEPVRALYDDLTGNARAAAFRDPRFTPLPIEELESTTIEVSVLSPTVPLPVASEEELLRTLQPHVHGLVIKLGHRRATFLPSVWETLATPEEFVTHLKRKAGIPAREWSEQMETFVYTVDRFRE